MPEEDNPFIVTPKAVKKEEVRTETFGTEEVISFMVTEAEINKKKEILFETGSKPHWEDAGTPIWDKKNVKDIHNPDYEVVDHEES